MISCKINNTIEKLFVTRRVSDIKISNSIHLSELKEK